MRILHTADLHLDSPFEGLSARQAIIRRKEQRELLQRLVVLSKEENVDLVFLCGDLFDSDSSYFETGEELISALGQIGVPVFISPGNHDYYSSKSPYARLDFPENVHIFTNDHIECFYDSKRKFKVFGGAYIDKNDPHLLKNFKSEPDNEILQLMCIHGDLSEQEIESSGMDYVAYGHIHKATGLKKAGNTYYSYCGCPEGRGFDELGEKTVNIVDVDKSSCEMKCVSIAKRLYYSCQINITDKDPLLEIKMLTKNESINDIYRFILTGQTAEKVDIGRIERVVDNDFFAVQIIDNTTLKKDIWDNFGEDTLRGLFLKKLKAQYDATSDEEEKSTIAQAARWGIAAMDNMEEISSHDN